MDKAGGVTALAGDDGSLGGGFGAALAKARRERGLELSDVSRHLKIRRCYLAALEAEDVAALPAKPFALGFLRAYARLLGLDTAALVAQLKARLEREQDAASLPAQSSWPTSGQNTVPEQQGGADKGRLARLFAPFAFTALALALGFYLPKLQESPAHTAQAAQKASDAHALSQAAAGAAHSGRSKAVSPARKAGVEPVPAVHPTAQPAHPQEQAAVGERIAASRRAPVILRMRNAAWVLVKDKTGRPLWSGVLAGGTVWAPPPGAAQLSTTHPGHIEVVIDGRSRGVLATALQPVLDVPLEPDALAAFLKERAHKARLVSAER